CTPTQMIQRLALTRNSQWFTSITGSTPDLQTIRAWTVSYGRFFTDDEVKKMAPVCMIGQTVRRHLFPDTPNPVGEWLRLDRLQLRVVGLLGEKGRSPTGADQDDQIFMPISTMERR